MKLFGWQLIRIDGHSMSPTLEHGDFALGRVVTSIDQLAIGDIIVFARSTSRVMIKRLVKKEKNNIFKVAGDGVLSTSSVDLGDIEIDHISAQITHRISPRGIQNITLRQ